MEAIKSIKLYFLLLVFVLRVVQDTVATSKENKATYAFKKGFKAVASPLAVTADIAETVAYFSGYVEESTIIGGGGNIIAGAMTGFVAGNLPGAVAGAVYGGVQWKIWNAKENKATYLNFILEMSSIAEISTIPSTITLLNTVWQWLPEETKASIKLEGLNYLEELKDVIMKICKEKDFLRSTLKFGAKSVGRLVANSAAKTTAKPIAKTGIKSAAKPIAGWIKTATNPVSIVSDVAQAGLEYNGYTSTGKVVGATGNIASGAALGLVAGGPVGAVTGAVGGAIIWVGGEIVGAVIDKIL